MFWDGTRWVDEGAKHRSRAAVRTRRVRDWIATIPIVLLVPALFAPLLATDAARQLPAAGSPTIHLRGSMAPGATIKISGLGFAPTSEAAILWDRDVALGEVKTSRKGSFVASTTIPPQAAPGRHAIAIAYVPLVAGTELAATIDVTIPDEPSNSDPTPAPTLDVAPTAAPTAEPTAAPTANVGPTSGPPSTDVPTSTVPPTPQPTPNPTPKPTPAPTPQPTPDPTPTPTDPPTVSRPFDAPVTTDTFRVPSSIDATGGTDASGALNAFIKSVPNGSVVSFPATGIYRLNQGLLLAGRNNVVLDGNGAQLRIRGSGSDEGLSAFLLRGSRHIAIRDFRVVGADPNWPANSGENAHVLGLSGWYGGGPSAYVEMANVRASHIFGDGVYLEGRNSSPYEPSHHVWVHHNTFDYMGRNAVSLINATTVLIEDNTFDHVSYHVLDIEPNFAAQVVKEVTFRQNDVGSYAHRRNLLGFFVSDVAIGSGVGSTVAGITIANNRVAGIASDGYEGRPRALNSKFITTGGNRHRDIVFRGNTTTRAVAGPAILYFSGIDGVRVTDNVQPLSSSSFAAFSSCTSVSYP